MMMLSNPSAHAIRLTLSNGSVRIVGPWGLAVLPDYSAAGVPIEVTSADLALMESTLDPHRPAAPDTQCAA